MRHPTVGNLALLFCFFWREEEKRERGAERMEVFPVLKLNPEDLPDWKGLGKVG